MDVWMPSGFTPMREGGWRGSLLGLGSLGQWWHSKQVRAGRGQNQQGEGTQAQRTWPLRCAAGGATDRLWIYTKK